MSNEPMPSITDEYERLQKLLVDSLDENDELKNLLQTAKYFLDCFVDDLGDEIDEDDVHSLIMWNKKFKELMRVGNVFN